MTSNAQVIPPTQKRDIGALKQQEKDMHMQEIE